MKATVPTRRKMVDRKLPMLVAGALLVAVTGVFSQQAHSATGLVVTDLNNGSTPVGLADALVGAGVSISNVTYTGDNRAAGTFTGGTGIIGFDSGVVLDSGKVQTYPSDTPCSRGVEGPNNCYESTATSPGGPDGTSNSTDFGLPGDTGLTALSGFDTYDASVLQFDFVPAKPTVTFSYVFGSEEYSDYANTAFNDVFGFFVNGSNCALVPGTKEPVSVNTINNGNDEGGDTTPHNAAYFVNNVPPTLNTQMDGLTTVLSCTAAVNPGVVNHMKLAIADASDGVLDSAVFIEAQSLTSVTPTTLTVDPASGDFHDATSVSAVLSDSNTKAGVPSEPVSFTLNGSETCTAMTDSTGTATCPITPGEASGTYKLAATFAGDNSFGGSEGSANFLVNTEETSLSYTGAAAVVNGQPLTMSGVLATDDPAAGTPLTGKVVTFTLGSGSGAQTCSGTTDGAGSATCTIPAVNQAAGAVPISATYAGDGYYQPASATAGAVVTTAGRPTPPAEDDSCTSLGHNYTATPFGLDTTAAGDLVVAYVAADGPAAGGQSVTVSGGGLKWTRLLRSSGPNLGDSEVWAATASGILSHAVVSTKTGIPGYNVALTVVAYKNASGVGAVKAFTASTGAPTGTVTTDPGGNTWVWAVGNDWLKSIGRTPASGQVIQSQFTDGGGDTYWVQSMAAPTVAGSTPVTIKDTAPTKDPYNLILVEIL